jgi:hypothetical protein
MNKHIVRLLIFGVASILIVVGVPFAERALLTPDAGVKLGGNLSKVQETAIGSAKDVATLLINWAFALVGFNAWFVRRAIESASAFRPAQKAACALGVIAAVVSVFFGQAALSGIALQLEYDMFSIGNRALRVPASGQFIALLLSVAAAAVLVIDEVFWPAAPTRRAVILED